ncbi:MAG: hypothetical protein EBR09_10050 [Proteobacteria bacterium]|nr:hypothetical protein [Pseudomonadota bacterium]
MRDNSGIPALRPSARVEIKREVKLSETFRKLNQSNIINAKLLFINIFSDFIKESSRKIR